MRHEQSAAALTGAGRLLTFLTLTVALVVGLLAMHAAGPHNTVTLPTAASSHTHEETSANAAVVAEMHEQSTTSCGGSCSSSEHDMAAGACVLALLVLLLFLAPAQLRESLQHLQLQTTPPRVHEGTAAAARPPSLEFLSINRR